MSHLRPGDGGHVCRHFGRCGGCQTQDRPYAEQLAHKRDRVIALLGRFVPASAIAAVSPMPVGDDGHPWGFRHKAAFVFGRAAGGRGLVMGHYAHGTRTIVPVTECPVHADRANRIAFALFERLAHARIGAAGPHGEAAPRPGRGRRQQVDEGVLRHIIVRTTHDQRAAVAMLVVTRNDRALRRPVQAFLDGPEAPNGFFLNIHDRPGPYMVGRETIRIAGRSHVREDHTGASFLISPTTFFQTNPEGARLLVDEVMAAAERGRTAPGMVLDLYSGSGLFAMPLAGHGWRVMAVEENAQAMRDAAANAEINDVPARSLRLMATRVEQALPAIRGAFDVVVLDPPRQGCGPAVIDEVFGRLAPPRVIYVSCDPTSLSRELPAIRTHGYRASRVLPVDMFPHTEHIELVVTLERE